MTPAEANLHAIAAAFCAPRIVREICPICRGRGKVACSTHARPEKHIDVCGNCGGAGSVLREAAP